MSKKVQMKNDFPVMQLFDPLELFEASIEKRKTESKEIIDKLVDAIADAGIIEKYVESKKGPQYVVELSDEIRKGLADGTIKLDKNSKGEIYAQIRDAGKYGKKLPIKEISAAADPVLIANAIQMHAIEEKLCAIVDALEGISHGVDTVREGQQNDRVGLYYSGATLYKEASKLSDSILRGQLTAQALKTLSDASSQEIQEIQSDISFIINKGHQALKNGNATKELDKRMRIINNCFDIIHQTAILRAKIYFDCNEMPSMVSVLEDYQRFLDVVIVPNREKLAEYDERDKVLVGGIWDEKAKLSKSIIDVKESLIAQRNMEEVTYNA